MNEPKPPPIVISRRVLRAIVCLFVAATVLAAASIGFTVTYVGYTNHRQHAEQARQAAMQQAAQLKAAIPLCKALHHLAQIQGTHGTSGATYGANLQAGLQQVYATTQCPKLLKGESS